MTSILEIYLLGEFRLIYGETAVTTFNSFRLQSLLAYLVLHHHTPQSRHYEVSRPADQRIGNGLTDRGIRQEAYPLIRFLSADRPGEDRDREGDISDA